MKRRFAACGIVDDHSDAVPFILASARAKRIRMGLSLLHFDAHPDLSLSSTPHSGGASSWRAKTLYEDLLSHNEGCIAEWILPLIYCGVIGERVTWIRSPWSRQFADGTYSFEIGDRRGGGSAVSLLEPYYTSEGAAVLREDLENSRPCTLVVSSSVDPACGEDYILDVCLDYFVTVNPFLGKVVAAMGAAQQAIEPLIDMYRIVYEQCRGDNHGDDGALRAVEHAVLHGARCDEGCTTGEAVMRGIDLFLGAVNVDALTEEARSLIVATKFLLLLPHRLPSDAELDASLLQFEEGLSGLHAPPSLITIARSSDDGYTPAESVDHVQGRVLSALHSFLDGLDMEMELFDLTENPLERSRTIFLNRNAKRYVVTQDADTDNNVDIVKKISKL